MPKPVSRVETAHEILAATRATRSDWQLSEMASTKELLVLGEEAPCSCRTSWIPRDRCALKCDVAGLEIDMDGIEIAVSMMDGPDLSDRRRRELALVLLMDAAIDVLLNTGEDGLDTRIETAKDMVREFKHVYPEAREV